MTKEEKIKQLAQDLMLTSDNCIILTMSNIGDKNLVYCEIEGKKEVNLIQLMVNTMARDNKFADIVKASVDTYNHNIDKIKKNETGH